MNDLSWMLYLADVAGRQSAALGVFSTFALIGGAVATVLGLTVYAGACGHVYRWEDPEKKQAAHDAVGNNLRKYGPRALKFAVVGLLIAAVIPSKATIYAIAASQVGEQALASKTGGKAVEALNAWLDKQIAGSGEDSAPSK